MKNWIFIGILCYLGTWLSLDASQTYGQTTTDVFRIGVIGTTTSHVPAFIGVINDPNGEELFQKFEVTAAYRGGMPDNPHSWSMVQEYADNCVQAGLTLYDSIEEMLEHVDGVLLESVDGRPHLEQAKPVFAAKKPLFIDKPMAGSLSDVIEIFRLAEENQVPVFSASSLRYVSGYQKMRNEQPLGKILGCEAMSPCSLNRKHPDFYWYGIHGVETLFTIMGPDCQSVARFHTEGADVAVGLWDQGRIGTFRGIRNGSAGYSAKVYAENGIEEAGTYEGYLPLAVEICRFFETGKSPIDPQETLNIFAFMSACDESLAQGSVPIALADVLERARHEKQWTVTLKLTADSALVWSDDATTDEAVPLAQLQEKIDSLAQEGTRVRIILDNRNAAPFDFVEQVLAAIDNAYLANYLY